MRGIHYHNFKTNAMKVRPNKYVSKPTVPSAIRTKYQGAMRANYKCVKGWILI